MSNSSSGQEISDVRNILIQYPLDTNPVVRLLDLILDSLLLFFFLEKLYGFHMTTLTYIFLDTKNNPEQRPKDLK